MDVMEKSLRILALILLSTLMVILILVLRNFLGAQPGTTFVAVTPTDTPEVTSIADSHKEEPGTSLIPSPEQDSVVGEFIIYPSETSKKTLVAVRERGYIVVGASIESGPYSYKENDRFEGFEVELVRELARIWFDLPAGADPEEQAVLKFIGTSVANREYTVRRKDVDFLVASVSYRNSRCLPSPTGTPMLDRSNGLICTASLQTSDPQALLTLHDSPIKKYCDLISYGSNALLLLLIGTTGAETLEQYKNDCGNSTGDIRVNDQIGSRTEAVMKVNAPLVAYKSNRWLLEFAKKTSGNPSNYKVIVSEFPTDTESYVVWLREENQGLRDLIDRDLENFRSSDKYKDLCKKFEDEIDIDCAGNSASS